MRFKFKLWRLVVIFIFLITTLNLSFTSTLAQPLKNGTYYALSGGAFTQDWSNTGLITTNDDWSGVNSIEGFRGDSLTGSTGTDPQTLLAADVPGVIDVIANQTTPSTNNSGGIAEFEITDPVVALQGSGTADAPYLKFYIDSTGCTNITVAYNIRDVDDAADNAIQQVALHYRTGASGDFTNVPAAFIADATTGPSLATLVTPISVTLPVNAENQPLLEIRIMTSNAADSDEWVGIDDINISGTCEIVTLEPKINEFSASTAGTDIEYIEIFGEPETDYSALSVLQIEGDSGSNPGLVESETSIGSTDIDGFYLADLTANTLQNNTLTLLLVENFTGPFDVDLDTNDDGVFDVTPWDSIVDSVAVFDGDTGDFTYGLPVLGPNFDGLSSYAPGGASRIPDGFDTEATTDWVRNAFNLAGIDGYTTTPAIGEAWNTPGAANEIYVPPPEACGDPFTPIYDVQGTGTTSPVVGTEVAIEGVVVGDFQDNRPGESGDLNGFFVQDLVGDSDSSTSDGIFVYGLSATDVNVGDEVRVRGNVSEYHNLTEISASKIWQCSTGNAVPAAIELSLPLTNVDDLEPFEGVLVTFPQALTISEYYNFGRYNEIVLTTERFLTPSAEFDPGPDAIAAADNFLLNKVTLDDGRSSQNSDPAIHPNGEVFDLSNLFRGGDTVANITGFMDQYDTPYRVQPIQGADYTPINLRPATPDEVGGNIKVASFNVLNYFTTLDDGVNDICGPSQNMECRGADTAEEFTRQRDKIIAAISAIDADVVGLMEIENNINDDAVIDLVAGLNDSLGAGTYDYVATGAVGTDAIKVALIYQPASVNLIGSYAVLDSSVDSRFLDDKNRPTIAQTFQDAVNGGYVTVAVNHLKSKGSDCLDVGDPDLGDGAGNCNLTRTAAAEAMVDWLASDPTGSGDGDYLIIGDLNSYDKEDPIDAILKGPDDVLGTSDDYTDMIYTMIGEDAYSYVFDGQIGYLDHALANATLVPQITGTTIWHINADEPSLIDYDMSYKLPAQDALYAPDPYRSSDHDPVIIGLDLTSFSMTPIEVNRDVPPGTSVKIPITITNSGLTPDTYDIVRLSDTKSISIGFPTVVGPVAPGESVTFDATVVVTENEPLGSTKTFILQATSREFVTSLTSTINVLVDYLRTYLPLIFK